MADEEYDFDPWETSSGLPDRVQIRIENPHFAFDAEYNNGDTCLFRPAGTALSGDGIDEPTEFDQFYPCGPGWEPAGKGGARIVREDGKAKKFNNNTAYAHLFSSLLKQAKEQGIDGELRKRGTPYDAGTWMGLVLDLKRVELPKFTDKEGKVHDRNLLLVENIVKMGDAKVGKAAASDDDEDVEKANVKSDGDSTASASSNGHVELDPKIKAKLRAAARGAESHAAFVEAAFDIEGVLDNPAIEQAVMDDGEGSIYATVKAEA